MIRGYYNWYGIINIAA